MPNTDETFNVPSEELNSPKGNDTVIIEKKNMHDSIMTEDNEDDEEMPLAQLKIKSPPKYATLPTRPDLRPKPGPAFKKGEVFK